MDYAVKTQQEVEKVSAWSKLDGAQQTTYLNELIGATQLDQLLDEAMKANPGLQQTLLTLKIRQAEYRQTNGSRLPTASAGFEATKKEGNDAAYTGSAAISWEADLWGKLATNSTAAGKDVAQQQALYQSARDTLAAEVMTAWLGLIAQQRSINIEQRRLGTLSQNEQFILQRYRKGLGTLEDLDSARSSVASSQATLEQYKEALAQQKRSLRSLLGRSAHLDLDILNDYPDVMIPLSDLPEQTLNRRPDLKAAYLAIEAADLRTSVAYKDLLPSISLEAALTDVADTPRQALFTNPVWSLLGQLTAPLFQGGQLKAAAEIAELETASAYQAYRETLLTAVTEVENALGQECSLAKQQAHLEKALENSRNNLEQYRNSYRKGLTEILDLLNVEQETYDLEAQLDNLIYERLANRVSLGLALGLGVHL
jgi:NodT family efflux transporter outer membrane factor (OMF) lipoprotein